MNEKTQIRQMSESFRTAASLALVGGFLETYTFLLHGQKMGGSDPIDTVE